MKGLLLTGAGLAVVMPTIVCAGPPEAENGLEEVVVTGEKSDRTVQQTTTSVAVTTSERMANEALVTLQDIYSRTGNVAETYGHSGYTIRGISNRGVSGAGTADVATVYIDGAPIPSLALYGGPTDLWDINQVEILRGPQSTIQGLNALAGSVVIKSTNPTMSWTAAGRVIWTDLNQRTFSAAVGGPIVQDQVAFRVSAERRYDEGLIVNTVRGGRDDQLSSVNLRAKLLITPEALPDLTVRLTYFNVRRNGGYAFEYTDTDVPDFYDHRTSTSNRPNTGRVDSDIGIADLSYRLAPHLRLSSTTSWNRVTDDELRDADDGPADSAYYHNTHVDRTFTQELRLNYDGASLNALLGAWYYSRKSFSGAVDLANIPTPIPTISALLQQNGFPADTAAAVASGYAAALPVIPANYQSAMPERIETGAVFGDARHHLTQQLSLLAGFRYDHETNQTESNATATFAGTYPDPASFGAPGTPLFVAITAINGAVANLVASSGSAAPLSRRTFGAFLPKAGLSMDWMPHLTTAFTVQRGYRSGGTSYNLARSELVAYDPEYTWNYEGSLRSGWLDGRLALNANVFYTDWAHQQVSVNRGLSIFDTNVVNAGRSHLWGFEVEASHHISSLFDWYASIGHVETRFDRFDLPATVASTTDLAGSQFPYAPLWTFALGANLRFGGGFTANLNVDYRSPVFTNVGVDQARQFRVSSRTLANLRFGYDAACWGAHVFVHNLFDEKYKHYDVPSTYLAVLGDPRAVGGEVDVRW